jgi:hypothetical protein
VVQAVAAVIRQHRHVLKRVKLVVNMVVEVVVVLEPPLQVGLVVMVVMAV